MEDKSKTMYLCIHALQVVPASCINRDDTGTPKTCVYGGTSRMRVSSQSWKRAARMYMKNKFGDTGVRTKFIVDILRDRIVEATECKAEEAEKFIKEKLKSGIISDKDDAKKTAAFFSEQQIEKLSELLIARYNEENNADKKAGSSEKQFGKEVIEAVKNMPSTSELLFGRMFANNPDLNYDAACQVAHAFSVNEVYDEPDYFTVVGDYKRQEALAGSDYLDTKLFNSGILYRFADVNLSVGSELRKEEYKVDAAKAASQFLEAFVVSMPSGSANAYANMTLPETVVVELRDDTPVSFAPAFVKAIEDKDICAAAIEKMLQYEDKISRQYGEPVNKWILGDGGISLKELCKQVEEEINRRL